jgi:hypothetical protein
MRYVALIFAQAILAACNGPASDAPQSGDGGDDNAGVVADLQPPEGLATVETPEPDRASAAPDDASQTPEAEAAVAVVEQFAELLEQRRFDDARRLYADGGATSGLSDAEFAARFKDFETIAIAVASPPRIEGAAGSLYAEVPLRLSGVLASGGRYVRTGTVTLRRANEVPGASEEQLQWRITSVRLAAG